jgi:hypothetical protein
MRARPSFFAKLTLLLAFAPLTLGVLWVAPSVIAATQFSANLSFESIEVIPPTTASGSAYLLGVHAGAERPGGWEFWADSVNLKRNHREGTGVLVAAIGDQQQYPEERAEYGPSFGFTTAILNDTYFLAFGFDQGQEKPGYTLQAQWQETTILPQPNFRFDSGTGTSTDVVQLPTSGVPEYPPFERPWPTLQVQTSGQHGALTLSGNLSLYVYGMDFTIRSNGHEDHYQTGEHLSDNVAVGPIDVVNRYDIAYATLDLVNATLIYRPAGTPYTIAFEAMNLDFNGTATLRSSSGQLDTGRAVEIRASRLDLELNPGHARLTLPVEPTANDLQRAHAVLTGLLTGYAIDGRPQPIATVAVTSSGDGWVWTVLGTVLLLAAGGAMAWAIRWSRQDVDVLVSRAEEALEQGHFGTALRAAKRAARSAPSDIDAVVIRCVSRLHLNQARLARLEVTRALNGPTPPPDRGTLHLLSSLCWLAEGEQVESEQELALAVSLRPDLMDEVQASPLFRSMRNWPFMARLAADWEASVSYG